MYRFYSSVLNLEFSLTYLFSLTCSWNETFEIPICQSSREGSIFINIFDHNDLLSHKWMGIVVLSLNDVITNGKFHGVVDWNTVLLLCSFFFVFSVKLFRLLLFFSKSLFFALFALIIIRLLEIASLQTNTILCPPSNSLTNGFRTLWSNKLAQILMLPAIKDYLVCSIITTVPFLPFLPPFFFCGFGYSIKSHFV
jgi:hypothetical protein